MISASQITELRGKKGQLVQSAAEIYESFFVPALFQQWPSIIADMLKVSSAQSVLDVACGTGILARHFAERVKDARQVHGVDVNDGMLQVAKEKAPNVQWRKAPAEALPFDSDCFDNVACQFGIMFFENREVALQEMVRVLKPGGKLAVAVWDKLENNPGYKSVTELLQQLFGDAIANEMRAPFNLGNKDTLAELFLKAGLTDFSFHTHSGTAQFPSIDEWVFTDIKGWTLADAINDEQFDRLLEAAYDALKNFTDSSGAIRFAAPAHIVIVEKTSS